MFSETRYALNGDLRVAYRASREGPRDIVFVANWLTCCELLPELPSVQGWVEAMTSLGRLIFFDQPGTGASDPVTPDTLPTMDSGPTASSAVLDDLGTREAVLVASVPGSRQRRCSRPPIRRAPPRWSCSMVSRMRVAPHSVETTPAPRSCRIGGRENSTSGKSGHAVERGDPGNLGTDGTSGAQPKGVRPHVASRGASGRAGGPSDSPRADPGRPAFRRRDRRPAKGRYIADHIPDAKYFEVPGRNWYHVVEPWRASFREVAEFLTGERADVPDDRVLATVLFTDIVDSTRRARRSATATGMRCSMRTTPWCGHSSPVPRP